MSSGPIVVTPDKRPEALDLGGEDITVLASGVQTGGAEMLSITSPAGAAAFFTGISRASAGDAPDFEGLVRIAASLGGTILPPPG